MLFQILLHADFQAIAKLGALAHTPYPLSLFVQYIYLRHVDFVHNSFCNSATCNISTYHFNYQTILFQFFFYFIIFFGRYRYKFFDLVKNSQTKSVPIPNPRLIFQTKSVPNQSKNQELSVPNRCESKRSKPNRIFTT